MKKLSKYDNYEEIKEVLRMKEDALGSLISYNARKVVDERDYSLAQITDEVITATSAIGGHLLYTSKQLDKAEYVLRKLQRIPGLGRIIRKLEDQWEEL